MGKHIFRPSVGGGLLNLPLRFHLHGISDILDETCFSMTSFWMRPGLAWHGSDCFVSAVICTVSFWMGAISWLCQLKWNVWWTKVLWILIHVMIIKQLLTGHMSVIPYSSIWKAWSCWCRYLQSQIICL